MASRRLFVKSYGHYFDGVKMAIEVTLKKTEPMTVAFLSMKGPYSLIGETSGKLYS